jgi:hypothetical protein
MAISGSGLKAKGLLSTLYPLIKIAVMKERIIFAILLLFFIPFCGDGQNIPAVKDKFVLLTMPYNQRPLNIYRGQLQIDAGYKFAVRAQSFDSNGKLVNLKSNGTGSVYHYYFAELRYGLTNFIELGAETDFLRRGIRDATTKVVSVTTTATETVTLNKLTESRGMGDLFVYTALQLPFEYHWFDIGIKGGMFLPTAKHESKQPTNTVQTYLTASNEYTVNLHYNFTNGYGVPVYYIGLSAKVTLGKFSSEAAWTMRTPMKEGTSIRWEETLVEKVFSYEDKSYKYLLSNSFTTDVSLHYQATGWFNVFVNGSIFRTKGGWTEYWGNKYINSEKRLVNIEPGFELQVSPSITIYQVAGFPVKGKNNDAPFYLFTTLSYNFFPFRR